MSDVSQKYFDIIKTTLMTLGRISMKKTYFYNVRTKSKVGVKLTKSNAKVKETSNGRFMLQVTEDDTKMSRFIGEDDKQMLQEFLGSKASRKTSRKTSRKASRKASKRRSACNKKNSKTCKKPCIRVRGSKKKGSKKRTKSYCRKPKA